MALRVSPLLTVYSLLGAPPPRFPASDAAAASWVAAASLVADPILP